MKTNVRTFFLLALISLITGLCWAYQVQFGERPEIDITRVPDVAVYHTHIRIKFEHDMTEYLDNNPVSYDDQGYAFYNLPEIDELNRLYSVKEAVLLFDSPALDNQYRDRHRAWGFHLWYELRFTDNLDIREIVLAYDKLHYIAVSEPEYRKELFVDSDIDNTHFRWTPNDPQFSNQWHYHNTGQQGGTPGADISLVSAWDIEKGSPDVIVAIVDGGIEITHPDLAATIWSGVGYNFVNNTPTISPHNHGTHVAGTVAAVNNNGVGVSGVAGGSGTGDGIRMMSCQVFTSSSSGGFHLAPVYAADNGASISQNSWGYTSDGYYDQNVLDAIDYFNLNGGGSALAGGITIFSAGNSNSTGQRYPGCYQGAFSVAATNNQDIRSWYSTYDTWVDISAPGGETNSVTQRGVLSTVTGGSYDYYQGTSMASPHVSGVAALMISLAYGYLNASDVADILRDTTDDHYYLNPGYIGMLGTGRMNALSALGMTLGFMDGVMNPQSFTVQTVSISQINLNWVPNSDNDEVMVVWSHNGDFGLPVEGVVYNAGDYITGGGTVLYRGSNTSYSHINLQSGTNYYYRAFSYDGDYVYSWGRSAQARTDAIVVFSEDFNDSTALPPGWQIIDNQGNGQVWQIGTTTGGLTGTTGNYAYLNSDAYGSGNSQNSDLITPTINLTDFSEVYLTFNHYFRSYTGSSGTLSYSINNGVTWTTIQTWTTTTGNPSFFVQNIPEVANQAQVKFKWNYTGTWGYYWCVDDVVIEVGGDAIGIGNLEGTVTLLGGTGNVTDVLIQANQFSTYPDNLGYYVMSIPSGTYTVTASHPVYEPQAITNVIVNEDETTSGINFNLVYIPQPQIEVTPTQLSAELDYGQSVTEQLLIINDGEADLTFNISTLTEQLITIIDDHDMNSRDQVKREFSLKNSERTRFNVSEQTRTDWLEVSPLSGTVPAGSSLTINVTFDATNMASGVYNTTIIINNNAGSALIIPVSMTVIPPPGEVTIGVGTNVNGTSTAAPINIWYRSLRGQMVYTVDEINTAGFFGPGLLTHLGFYVHQAPIHSLPNFIIRIKHTTATNAAAHDNGPFELAYSSVSYTPSVGGWDMLLLDTPFEWNGIDNILIDTAFSMVPSYSSTGQQRIFTQTNGFRYSWSDTADQTNQTTNSTSSNKPQIRLLFVDEAGPSLPPPTNLIAIPGDGVVDLSWDAPQTETPLGYNIYRDSVPLNTTLVLNLEYSDTNVVNGVTYSYYVKAVYTEGESQRSNIVTARPSGVIYLDEDFTDVDTGSLPPDWFRTHNNWGVASSSNAGGNTPELSFYWNPSTTDVFRVVTPLVALPDLSQVILSFKHMVDHYSGSYTLKVQISVDQINWNTIWEISPTGNVAAQTVNILLEELSNDNLYFAWVFDGYSWNINYWYLDDIELTGSTIPELPIPENLNIEIVNGYAELSWDLVEGANSYKIYATDDPYFLENEWVLVATVGSNEFSEPASGERKFYKIVASTEPLPAIFHSDQDNAGIRSSFQR